jgi:hypothetical protein
LHLIYPKGNSASLHGVCHLPGRIDGVLKPMG